MPCEAFINSGFEARTLDIRITGTQVSDLSPVFGLGLPPILKSQTHDNVTAGVSTTKLPRVRLSPIPIPVISTPVPNLEESISMEPSEVS